eukprot:GDKJ01049949.1.p1 GENE.GDKJ01049949.1~~GDKJ01049949.1.p1  ORF type:complete len:705 (-),score=153.62 GDKJ01049949.1:213-2327(-)
MGSRFVIEANMFSEELLKNVRSLMTDSSLDFFVVTDNDFFSSEEPPAAYARRSFISGFNGSNGTGIISKTDAVMETDSRYFIQCDKQLHPGWKRVDNAIEWIKTNSSSTLRVGLDRWCTSKSFFDALKNAMPSCEIVLLDDNLVDRVWKDRPSMPNSLAYVHQNSGMQIAEKFDDLAKRLTADKSDATVLYCDQVCWILNMRGFDYQSSPLFISFLVFEVQEHSKWKATLFCYTKELLGSNMDTCVAGVDGKSDSELGQYLLSNNVSYMHISKLGDYYQSIMPSLKLVSLCPNTTNALFEFTPQEKTLKTSSHVDLMKTKKNKVEISAMIDGHTTDGLALSRFIHWLDLTFQRSSSDSAGTVSEWDVALKNKHFRTLTASTQLKNRSLSSSGVRKNTAYDALSLPAVLQHKEQQGDYVAPSFPCLAQCGPNAAMPHYTPTHDNCSVVKSANMFLCDSGAQYARGCTTDVTRTLWLGCDSTGAVRATDLNLMPSAKMISGFTRVLMGFLDCCDVVFPEGTSGQQLDILARQPLRDVGLDFGHGTGHGVGSFGLVHEPPVQIRPVMGKRDERRWWDSGLFEGAVTSVEPGLYIEGEWGVRIENLVYVSAAGEMIEGNGKRMMKFEHLTLAPICKSLIDVQLMSDKQIDSLNKYHADVYEKLTAIVDECFDDEEEKKIFVRWLKNATSPLDSPRKPLSSPPPKNVYM